MHVDHGLELERRASGKGRVALFLEELQAVNTDVFMSSALSLINVFKTEQAVIFL